MLSYDTLQSSLPVATVLIGTRMREAVSEMNRALNVAFDNDSGFDGITHTAPVIGLPGSCRLLLSAPHPAAFDLPCVYRNADMAHDLIWKFAVQARFPPKPKRVHSFVSWTCFEVRKLLLTHHPAALVLAGWSQQRSAE